jgi:hypothetical protein
MSAKPLQFIDDYLLKIARSDIRENVQEFERIALDQEFISIDAKITALSCGDQV